MTEWFEKKAGDEVLIGKDEPVLLIGDTLPDWVRLPPELGGGRLRVLRGFVAPCPKCCVGGPVTHLKLESDTYVAECKGGCGFVWYNRKSEE
jgi:hypothetical protein